MDYNKRFEEYAQRMNNLKCYFPFFHIYLNHHNNDTYGCDISFLAMDTLKFLLDEGKLKNRSVPLSEIEAHFTDMLKVMHPDRNFSPEEVHEIAMVITRMLESSNSSGDVYNFCYSNYAVPKEENLYLKLIKYDLTAKAYDISDTGLDLMINTKELFEESKIKINLILFQHQIQNGYFDTALQTVQNLSVAVHKLREEKKSVLEQLMYTGLDALGLYTKFQDRVQSQLNEENNLFMEVNEYISKKTRDIEASLEDGQLADKYTNRTQYQILLDIKNEFELCLELYKSLVSEYMGMFREYENISKTRIQSLGSKRFMFEDSMKEHVCANLPNMIHVGKVHPLLLTYVQKRFDPMKIYEPQQIIRKRVEPLEKIDKKTWTDELSIDDQMDKTQMEHFVIYSKLLLDILSKSQTVDLKTYLNEVMRKKGLVALQNPNLIQFLIELNVIVDSRSSDEDGVIPQNNSDLPYYDPYVTIFDCNEISTSQSRTLRLIERSISDAQAALDVQLTKLKVVSIPDDIITIDEDDGSYITNMTFTAEW